MKHQQICVKSSLNIAFLKMISEIVRLSNSSKFISSTNVMALKMGDAQKQKKKRMNNEPVL